MKFAVGDAVEIVRVSRPQNEPWVGRRTVVVSYFMSDTFGEVLYRVADHPPKRGPCRRHGFAASSLRKINPPDWEAPRVRDKELQA